MQLQLDKRFSELDRRLGELHGRMTTLDDLAKGLGTAGSAYAWLKHLQSAPLPVVDLASRKPTGRVVVIPDLPPKHVRDRISSSMRSSFPPNAPYQPLSPGTWS